MQLLRQLAASDDTQTTVTAAAAVATTTTATTTTAATTTAAATATSKQHNNILVDHADQLTEYLELVYGIVMLGPEERRLIVDVCGLPILTTFYATDFVGYHLKGDRMVPQPKSPDLKVLGEILLVLVSSSRWSSSSSSVSASATGPRGGGGGGGDLVVPTPYPTPPSLASSAAAPPPPGPAPDREGGGGGGGGEAADLQATKEAAAEEEAKKSLWNQRFLCKFCRLHPTLALQLLERMCKVSMPLPTLPTYTTCLPTYLPPHSALPISSDSNL